MQVQSLTSFEPSGEIANSWQFAQAALLISDLNVFSEHIVQVKSINVYEASQRQSAANVLASCNVVACKLHDVQIAEPAFILYVPVAQAVHGPPWGPVNPASHLQSKTLEAQLSESLLSGQSTQTCASFSYFPAGRNTHVSP